MRQNNESYERAVDVICIGTTTHRDIAERFVLLFWNDEMDEEENLAAFESYRNEMIIDNS